MNNKTSRNSHCDIRKITKDLQTRILKPEFENLTHVHLNKNLKTSRPYT